MLFQKVLDNYLKKEDSNKSFSYLYNAKREMENKEEFEKYKSEFEPENKFEIDDEINGLPF
jgi:hypothetical protein